MLVKNMTEFRKNMKSILDHVDENEETVVIYRSNDKDVAIIPLRKLGGFDETAYLMSSEENKSRLKKATNDINNRKNLD